MTRKLFYEDPYRRECLARVVKLSDGKVLVDQTVFFAFTGGQVSDSGWIGGVRVEEAKVSNGDIIYFLGEPPSFGVGDQVVIRIDWGKRYRVMRLHSATHIIYFLFAEKTGVKELIGSNVGDGKARLDYSYPEPITKLLPELEEEANRVFSRGLEIKTFWDEERPGLRWWECKGWRIACGGTHVRNTKEIGKAKLKRRNIGAGKERIEIRLS